MQLLKLQCSPIIKTPTQLVSLLMNYFISLRRCPIAIVAKGKIGEHFYFKAALTNILMFPERQLIATESRNPTPHYWGQFNINSCQKCLQTEIWKVVLLIEYYLQQDLPPIAL